ncbi:MAG: tetraacyldisaccharide 4'-kinase [Beijerinckiaceae bacterium]|nr:tetraacyldisaccharide 4'-kinase [Beijerinckiaceae bacterium]
MRAPAFWWKPAPDVLAHLLSPLGALYGAVVARRMEQAGERVGARVICVGNFVAGGAGKTPTAIALAHELIKLGQTPFFVSRGYGAQAPVTTPVVVDPATHDAANVGDEPLLLARVAPAIVCADRVAGARLAVARGASVIIMDDGLQNPALAKDFRIAVVDGVVGVGNGKCIPAGPLRAPLGAQLKQVDCVVVIGANAGSDLMGAEAKASGVTVCRARLTPDADAAARLRGARVFAFAGIGRPEKFFDTLSSLGADVAGVCAFADHHTYSPAQLAELQAQADEMGATLITTEKDRARIGSACAIDVLPVSLESEEPGLFARLAHAALTGQRFKA